MSSWPRTFLDADDWVSFDGRPVTSAASSFLHQHQLDLQYLTADKHLLEVLEETAVAVDGALSAELPHPATPMQDRLQRANVRGAIAMSDRVRGELALTRYVDNYLTYIADLLREIFIARPDTLRSREQLTVDEVLSNATMEDLTAYLADRKVTRLSFRGLGELTDYFAGTLGLRLVEDPELRDCRGIVDERAIASGLDAAVYAAGERVRVSSGAGFRMMAGVVVAVLDIDERAASKFALAREEHAEARSGQLGVDRRN